MKEIKLTVSPSENFTASSLMHRYANQNTGSKFYRSNFGEALLTIEGTAYRYHHWSITAANAADVVTLYLMPCTIRN
jgi:hypothetical protein